MRLLAVDPSVRSVGLAEFHNGELWHCWRVISQPSNSIDSEGARWLRVSRDVIRSTDTLPDTIVYERPQIYRASKSKGDPNDLLGLVGVGASVAALLATTNPNLEIQTPTPAEWIGQIPKTTRGSALKSPRAQRILGRLLASERALVPDQHDVIDAVGLGLHVLGRLGVRRVYSTG